MICSLNDIDVTRSAGSTFVVLDLGFVIFGNGQRCVKNGPTMGRL